MNSSENAAGLDAAALRDLEAYCRQRRAIFYPKTDAPFPDQVLRDLRRPERPRELLDPRLVAELCEQALGERAAEVRPLAQQGTFHVLYRVELARRGAGGSAASAVILRANALSHLVRDFQLHVDRWVADLLRAAGLPVVPVLHVDLSRRLCPLDYELLGEAPGRSLSACDHDDALLLPWLRQLGRVLARVHGIQRPGFGWLDVRPLVHAAPSSVGPPSPTFTCTGAAQVGGVFDRWSEYVLLNLEAHIRTCVDIAAISAEEAGRIERVFNALTPLLDGVEPALLHGDPGNHNIFTDVERITAIIDWEDCLLGDPVYDIAFWATFHPDRRHAALLEGYRSERALPADFDLRFWLYYLRVALAKTVHRWRFAYPGRPDQPPAARRIQHALARLENVLYDDRVER